MSNYITVDGGTTNTRICLVVNGNIVDTIKYNVGAGKSVDNKNILKNTIKEGISEILKRNNIQSSEILRILASGMLTSEYGIYTLEHIKTPVGIKKLHEGMTETVISEISNIPFVLMRGIKTDCNCFESADMMRGEETELMGLADSIYGDCVYILPGSHSKIIKTDNMGEITDFSTMLTGEMIAAVSQNTILKAAVDLENTVLNNEYLMKGFEYCKENGINKALFKVRVLNNIFSGTADEVYSFFMGVVLCEEILEIIKLKPKNVVIGGKRQIKKAMYVILSSCISAKVICVSDETAEKAASVGMIKIFEFQK
jgi:2-dehydro-3-deoxygalactonokinase